MTTADHHRLQQWQRALIQRPTHLTPNILNNVLSEIASYDLCGLHNKHLNNLAYTIYDAVTNTLIANRCCTTTQVSLTMQLNKAINSLLAGPNLTRLNHNIHNNLAMLNFLMMHTLTPMSHMSITKHLQNRLQVHKQHGISMLSKSLSAIEVQCKNHSRYKQAVNQLYLIGSNTSYSLPSKLSNMRL